MPRGAAMPRLPLCRTYYRPCCADDIAFSKLSGLLERSFHRHVCMIRTYRGNFCFAFYPHSRPSRAEVFPKELQITAIMYWEGFCEPRSIVRHSTARLQREGLFLCFSSSHISPQNNIYSGRKSQMMQSLL